MPLPPPPSTRFSRIIPYRCIVFALTRCRVCWRIAASMFVSGCRCKFKYIWGDKRVQIWQEMAKKWPNLTKKWAKVTKNDQKWPKVTKFDQKMSKCDQKMTKCDKKRDRKWFFYQNFLSAAENVRGIRMEQSEFTCQSVVAHDSKSNGRPGIFQEKEKKVEISFLINWKRFLNSAVSWNVLLGTKHMAPPGGATSKRLDSVSARWISTEESANLTMASNQ